MGRIHAGQALFTSAGKERADRATVEWLTEHLLR
jgi:hypothetical protein